jgi:hypothetical protein
MAISSHRKLPDSSQPKLRGYYVHRVEPDGNCFFHAVVDQLQQLGIRDARGELYTHELLRGIVASFAETNVELQSFFTDSDLTDLRTLTGWVGHESIQIFADILKVKCIIIKDENPQNDVIINPNGVTVFDDTPVLHLYYKGINHYDSLRTNINFDLSESSMSGRSAINFG